MGQKLVLVIIVVVVLGGAGWWMMGQGESAPIAQNTGSEELSGTEQDVKVTPRQYAPTQQTTQTQTQTQTQGVQHESTTEHSGATGSQQEPAPAPQPTPTATVAATASVSIQSFAFGNGSITVKKGTKVTWTNSDTAPHTVTSTQGGVPNGTFESGNLNTGASYSFTFDTPGTYTYVCKYHPSMKATVIVTE